jgi:hypothetical protein
MPNSKNEKVIRDYNATIIVRSYSELTDKKVDEIKMRYAQKHPYALKHKGETIIMDEDEL